MADILGAALTKDASVQAIFKTDGDSKPDTTERSGGPSPLVPKEFYWDQIVLIIASAILGLSLLDLLAEFFRGTGVQCYSPSVVDKEMFTRDRAGYVNSYCNQSLPPSEYYTLFILVHGLAIVAPHYLWSSLFGGKFDYFFALVKDLNRLRNLETGRYDANNYEIVRKLEEEYRHKTIYVTYVIKLLLQLLFSLASFVIGLFYFKHEHFSSTFPCPANNSTDNMTLPDDWPLDTAIYCVYSSLRYLSLVRYLDIVLVGVAVIVLLYGCFWCFIRHPDELGSKSIAKFVVSSCLLARYYVPKPWLSHPFSPRVTNDIEFLLMRLYRTDAGHGKVFKEIQIQKEINQRNKEHSELLQMFLTADSDNRDDDSPKNWRIKDLQEAYHRAGFHGAPTPDVYKDSTVDPKPCEHKCEIQELEMLAQEMIVQEETKIEAFVKALGDSIPHRVSGPQKAHLMTVLQEWKRRSGGTRKELIRCLRCSELGTLEERIKFGVYLLPFPVKSFQNQLSQGLVQFAPNNEFAMVISFGSSRCSTILAWKFKKVASANFDTYVSGSRLDVFYTNVMTMQFPPDIWAQQTDNIHQFEFALERVMYGLDEEEKEKNKKDNTPKHLVSFFVIEPLDDEAKGLTVTLLIDKLMTDPSIDPNAVLLAVRPLKIGSKDVSHRFVEYTPPSGIFEKIDDDGQLSKLITHLGDVCLQSDTSHNEGGGRTGNGVTVASDCSDVVCVFQFTLYKFHPPLTYQAVKANTTPSNASDNDVHDMANNDVTVLDPNRAQEQENSGNQNEPIDRDILTDSGLHTPGPHMEFILPQNGSIDEPDTLVPHPDSPTLSTRTTEV